MTIRKLKALLWFLAFAGFLGASYTFYDIWEGKRAARYDPRAPDYYHQLIRRDLGQVEDTGSRKAYYAKESYETLWQARIDGFWPEPKPDAAALAAGDEQAVPTIEPLDQVVEIGSIVWSSDPLDRWISLKYLQDKNLSSVRSKVRSIHVSEGGMLRPPYDEPPYSGRVLEIGEQVVRFHWGDDEVELTPGLGRDGKGLPQSQFSMQLAEDPMAGIDELPEETIELGPGNFLVGSKDRAELAEDAPRILREDLVLRSLPPAQEGGRSSLQLKQVAPDSLPARYGFRSGDRLISVNGVPMVSEAAAINWYKANPDEPYYNIVYERAGGVRSVTMHVH